VLLVSCVECGKRWSCKGAEHLKGGLAEACFRAPDTPESQSCVGLSPVGLESGLEVLVKAEWGEGECGGRGSDFLLTSAAT
jgi:hypothetical protein